MIPMKKRYDAGELHGEKPRGMMTCTGSDRWYNSAARPPITTDPEKVTRGKCLRKMGKQPGA